MITATARTGREVPSAISYLCGAEEWGGKPRRGKKSRRKRPESPG